MNNYLLRILRNLAKRKRKTNKKTDEKRLKEGRGTGRLATYKPWLHIQDLASKGLSTRIKGMKTGRIHHLLSRLELYVFYCLDWSKNVSDIREQYPLDQRETLAIAKMLNIRHPQVPSTKDWAVMTTDFLITIYQSLDTTEVAFNVKYSKDLNNKRTIEKFEIERYYWERRGVKWRIVTEKDINHSLVNNIEWIHSFYKPDWLLNQISSSLLQEVADFTFNLAQENQIPLRKATNISDEKFNFSPGVSLSLVRHLIATRKWAVDMTFPIQPEKPLQFVLLS